MCHSPFATVAQCKKHDQTETMIDVCLIARIKMTSAIWFALTQNMFLAQKQKQLQQHIQHRN